MPFSKALSSSSSTSLSSHLRTHSSATEMELEESLVCTRYSRHTLPCDFARLDLHERRNAHQPITLYKERVDSAYIHHLYTYSYPSIPLNTSLRVTRGKIRYLLPLDGSLSLLLYTKTRDIQRSSLSLGWNKRNFDTSLVCIKFRDKYVIKSFDTEKYDSGSFKCDAAPEETKYTTKFTAFLMKFFIISGSSNAAS